MHALTQVMDPHRHFVGPSVHGQPPAQDRRLRRRLLVGAGPAAYDDGRLASWSALIEHTDGRLAHEDLWMRQTGFASRNCHSTQHRAVLADARTGLGRIGIALKPGRRPIEAPRGIVSGLPNGEARVNVPT